MTYNHYAGINNIKDVAIKSTSLYLAENRDDILKEFKEKHESIMVDVNYIISVDIKLIDSEWMIHVTSTSPQLKEAVSLLLFSFIYLASVENKIYRKEVTQKKPDLPIYIPKMKVNPIDFSLDTNNIGYSLEFIIDFVDKQKEEGLKSISDRTGFTVTTIAVNESYLDLALEVEKTMSYNELKVASTHIQDVILKMLDEFAFGRYSGKSPKEVFMMNLKDIVDKLTMDELKQGLKFVIHDNTESVFYINGDQQIFKIGASIDDGDTIYSFSRIVQKIILESDNPRIANALMCVVFDSETNSFAIRKVSTDVGRSKDDIFKHNVFKSTFRVWQVDKYTHGVFPDNDSHDVVDFFSKYYMFATPADISLYIVNELDRVVNTDGKMIYKVVADVRTKEAGPCTVTVSDEIKEEKASSRIPLSIKALDIRAYISKKYNVPESLISGSIIAAFIDVYFKDKYTKESFTETVLRCLMDDKEKSLAKIYVDMSVKELAKIFSNVSDCRQDLDKVVVDMLGVDSKWSSFNIIGTIPLKEFIY